MGIIPAWWCGGAQGVSCRDLRRQAWVLKRCRSCGGGGECDWVVDHGVDSDRV